MVGHCRGIDNAIHPRSRTLVLEVLPELRGAADDALLAAQFEVSTRPLSMKIDASARHDLALARRHRAVLVQLCPPWRFTVDAALHTWAAGRGGACAPVTDADRPELLDQFVHHYRAQHAWWSPAASIPVLAQQLRDGFEPGDASFDLARSRLLRRDGTVVAAGLLWPPEDDGEPAELTLTALPYQSPTARVDLEACLAAVLTCLPDGAVVEIDSHVTEPVESALVRDLPATAEGEWLAIVEVPVPGGPTPVPLFRSLVPDACVWARDL
ncbi:hypothetical protein [Arsenicicoccus dermatophilus]|uniref:hypothetical protein n=1 Tax=Arsenicicoccus dermatophilus TaxID=1076331 RepID=UPI00391729D8